MKTPRIVKGYLIFELAAIVVFGYLLTPVNGAKVFLLGPHTGLIMAVFALFFNPLIGIFGLAISGRELYRKSRKALIIVLLVLSLGFAALFPAIYLERGIAQAFGTAFAR